jgi:hypothetical protein
MRAFLVAFLATYYLELVLWITIAFAMAGSTMKLYGAVVDSVLVSLLALVLFSILAVRYIDSLRRRATKIGPGA